MEHDDEPGQSVEGIDPVDHSDDLRQRTIKAISAIVDLVVEYGRRSEPLPPELAGMVYTELTAARDLVQQQTASPRVQPFRQLEPNMLTASRIMILGREQEERDLERKEKESNEIQEQLTTIFCELSPLGRDSVINLFDKSELQGQLKDLAQKLMNISKPSTALILSTLMGSVVVRNNLQIPPDRLSNAFGINEGETRQVLKAAILKLRSLMGITEIPISPGFEKLREDYFDLLLTDPERLWGHKGDEVSECKEANRVAVELFGESYSIPPSIQEINDIAELRKKARTIPVDSMSFEEMRGAIIKLELMRLIFYTKELKLPHLKAEATHLKTRLDRMVETKKYPGRIILNPPNSNKDGTIPQLEEDGYHCEVDRVETDEEAKQLAAVVRKMILKSSKSPKIVNDAVRFRVIMPEFISDDKATLIEAIKKAIGIIIVEFGTDYDVSRIRYTLESGGSNKYSQGKHVGVHITFKMRSKIADNGIEKGGEFTDGSVDVEGQFLAFMTAEEEEEDHRLYLKGKEKDVCHALGADLSFKDYVMQLIEVINTNHDFKDEVEPYPKSYIGNRPIRRGENIREKILLLDILRRRDRSGKLCNESTLLEILEDRDDCEKLLRTISKLRKHPSSKIKMQLNREYDMANAIRSLAKEVNEMVKFRDLNPAKTSYEIKEARGNWYIRNKKSYLRRPTNVEKWRLYHGPLYMIKEEKDDGTYFYTVSSIPKKVEPNQPEATQEGSPELTAVIRGEKGDEKCYSIDDGKETLIWERVISLSGTRIIRYFNRYKEIEIEDTHHGSAKEEVTPNLPQKRGKLYTPIELGHRKAVNAAIQPKSRKIQSRLSQVRGRRKTLVMI